MESFVRPYAAAAAGAATEAAAGVAGARALRGGQDERENTT